MVNYLCVPDVQLWKYVDEGEYTEYIGYMAPT